MKLTQLFAAFLIVFIHHTSIVAQCDLGDECQNPTGLLLPDTDPGGALDYNTFYEGCIEDVTPDPGLDYCGHDDLPTMWIPLVVDGTADYVYIRVKTKGSWTPVFSLYQGSCNDLRSVPHGDYAVDVLCNTDYECGDQYFYKVNNGAAPEYLIALSALGRLDDPNFEIEAGTVAKTQYCYQPSGETDNYTCKPSAEFIIQKRELFDGNPDPDNDGVLGPFCPSEELTVCMDYIYDNMNTSQEWLQAIIPQFGDLWDPINISRPATVNPDNGQWLPDGVAYNTIDLPRSCTYVDATGVLRYCNDLCEDCPCFGPLPQQSPLPAGYFWVSNGANGCLNTGHPADGYGLPLDVVSVYLCFELKVKDFDDLMECAEDADLDISFNIFTDAMTGCWFSNQGVAPCSTIPPQLAKFQLECSETANAITANDTLTIDSGDEVNASLVGAIRDSMVITVTPIANTMIMGAEPVEGLDSITITDPLTNLTNTTQTQNYLYYSTKIGQFCPSDVDTLTVIVEAKNCTDPIEVIDLQLCEKDNQQLPHIDNGNWTSANPSVVTINPIGLITAVSPGVTVVDFEYPPDTCLNRVYNVIVAAKPTGAFTGANEICVGQVTSLSPTTGGIWTSENDLIVTVDNTGLAIGESPGVSNLTFTDLMNNCSSDPLLLTVHPTPIIQTTTQSLCVDGPIGQVTSSTIGEWTSDNTDVVTVDAQGVLTPISPGTANITLIDPMTQCKSAALVITVDASPLITLTGVDTINIGEATTFTSNETGTWLSNSPIIASINQNGVVTGLSPGIVTFTFTSNNSSCVVMSQDIVVLPDAPTYKVLGVAYVDTNTNGQYDAGENRLSNFKITDLGNTMSYFTDVNGMYSIDVPLGVFNGQAMATYGSWLNPMQDFMVNVTPDTVMYQRDFGFIVDVTAPNATLSVAPKIFRCNNVTSIRFSALNIGNVPLDGKIVVEVDSALVNPVLSPTAATVSEFVYETSFMGLASGASTSSKVTFVVPQAMSNNDSLYFKARLYDDANNLLSEISFGDLIRCSYDPNDKMVQPDRPGEENYILAGEELVYAIRFQNNGNDTAFYVQIQDVLDPRLDATTLKIREASHDLDITQHFDTLFFTFNDILLVDSTTNFEASQGFVSFSIQSRDDLQSGEIINNEANIFFDFNDPIMTNKTINTIIDILPCFDAANSISIDEGILHATPGGVNYIWLDCATQEVLQDGPLATYDPMISGDYQVIYQGLECQNTSDCINFMVSKADDLNSQRFKVFPNPAIDKLFIQGGDLVKSAKIYNLVGQEWTLPIHKNVVSLQGLEKGLYFIKIKVNGEEQESKFIKI